MPEELRIVVVDQGGAAPSRGPAAPGGGQFPGGPATLPFQPPSVQPSPGQPSPPSATPTQPPPFSQSPKFPVAPPVQPPPFVKAPPLPKTPTVPDQSKRAVSGIGTVGGIAGAAAAGNVAGAASGASSGIVAAVGGPVGVAVAAVAAGFGVAAIAATKFAQMVETQTTRLAGFSGPLSAAQARTEIERELGLFRRAQRVGPALASAERLRSKFEGTMTDLGTEIMQVLLRLLEELRPVIEIVIAGTAATTGFLERHGDAIAQGAIVMARGVAPEVTTAVQIIAGIARLMQSEVDRREDEELEDPFTQQFLDLLPRDANGQPLFWPAGQPVPQPGV